MKAVALQVARANKPGRREGARASKTPSALQEVPRSRGLLKECIFCARQEASTLSAVETSVGGLH